ncbi:hypothetical protein GCM10020358_84860 [Amorphoplanes nipponensis]|uniref:FtsX extracellular domain-containing protein n=1 Tax=Actinoplanes nipponensis TaxID=135950 RepID=A0A919MGL3_9ACTN|nr:permease-like cell division protein FtsX [Actinoplanes nipponensis]GIE48709.1 hypothetical protein Ani05nite_22430 [Actinoplanes nipponensis]
MHPDLRGLFQRALDDEPWPAPGDPVAQAMAQGRRIRRRRGLLAGGSAAVLVAAAGLVAHLAFGPAPAPPSSLPQVAIAMGPADPSCTWPVRDAATDVSLFLSEEATAVQISGLRDALRADPGVRDVRFESRAQAYQRFKELWHDDPDFLQSVSAESLPQSFRVQLTQPSEYPRFAAAFTHRPGVADLVGRACPGTPR